MSKGIPPGFLQAGGIFFCLLIAAFALGFLLGQDTAMVQESKRKPKEWSMPVYEKKHWGVENGGFCDAWRYLPGGQQRPFFDIAKDAGTDKVTAHEYHIPYQDLLGPLSVEGMAPFKMIEIGFAFGSSAQAWHTFLPAADVHEIEFACTEDKRGNPNFEFAFNAPLFQPMMDAGRMHCGDGSDPVFLAQVLAKIGTPPLVVVDDGGHGPDEMKGSFNFLFPRIAPCGYFIMEDLQESFTVKAAGFLPTITGPLVLSDLHADPTHEHTKDLATNPAISDYLRSVTCYKHLCIFQRNQRPPKQ